MTNLPASRDALQGAPISTETLPPTDFGIEGLGQALERHEAVNRQVGAKQAQVALRGVEQAYEGQFTKAAASYTGETPGFAVDQGKVWDAESAKALAGLKGDAAINAYQQISAQAKSARVMQAMDHEGSVLGGIAHQQASAAQVARVAKTAQAFSLQQQDVTDADSHNGDVMRDPTYLAGRLQRFDGAAQEALESTPEYDRGALQNQFTQQRANLMADLHQQGFQLREQQTQTDVTSALTAITNRVAANPAYAGQAAIDAQQVTSALPVELRGKVQAKIPGDILRSVASGFQARQDLPGLQHFLADPQTQKHMDEGDYENFNRYATSTAAAATQAMLQDTAKTGLDNELQTIVQTGQSSGFDPSVIGKAYGPVDGPVMEAQARKQIAAAQSDHALVDQAGSLSAADFTARVEQLKPKAGDADFAIKQQRYDRAMAIGQAVISQRLTDPAGYAAGNKDTQPLWQAYKSGQPGAANAWAADTLRRQTAWGVPEAQQRILPVGEAKSWVQSIDKAPPEQRDEVMAATWQRLVDFGGNATRVLSELQTAGLDGRDAAVIHASDGNPVIFGQYARAVERNKGAPKFAKDVQGSVDKAVDRASTDFVATWGHTTDGQIYADNWHRAVQAMTEAAVHDGKKPDDAARFAVQTLSNGAVIDDNLGYRLPAAVAGDRVKMDYNAVPKSLFGGPARVGDAVHYTDTVDGRLAMRRAAYATLRDYAIDPSTLYAAGPETYLTNEQKQQRQAATVAEKGRWITMDDESGLQLVLDDPKSGVVRVRDAAGKPIVRSWAQLKARVTGGK